MFLLLLFFCLFVCLFVFRKESLPLFFYKFTFSANIRAYGIETLKILFLPKIIYEWFETVSDFILVVAYPVSYARIAFEFWKNIDFVYEYFSFSLTWDPMGVKISKC